MDVGRGGDSPLHAAVRRDSAEQVSLLLEYGADLNVRDENNQRPVELVSSEGRVKQLLLSAGSSGRPHLTQKHTEIKAAANLVITMTSS